MRAKIIVLNGVGSAGKGSIAKALQGITSEAFLHVEMDSFIDMMPNEGLGRPGGLDFVTSEEDGRPSVAIRTGALAQQVLRGVRRAVAAMAAEGLNLIVDDVMLDRETRRDYDEGLRAYTVHHVGVFAPLDVLEARERQRGDRLIGLARWQYARVHRGMRYDLAVDTGTATPQDCAELIRRHFGL